MDDTGVEPPVVSDGDRSMLLGRALEPYIDRGWQVDERTDVRAVISKEWGFAYMLLGLPRIWFELLGREWSSNDRFKRRAVTVDRSGRIDVKRLRSRGSQVSRYGSN